MGIIWRHAMPLMTTLAALVLIVHTAEEDMESEYRHDLRPRILDTKTPSYDQSWRAMEAEPIMQPAQNENWDNKSLEELPKRRRPGRKRKRRPQTSSIEDIGGQYPDEPPRPYFDVTSHNARQTTEMPRRRKKPDARPIRWTDDAVDFERPLRRRNQRRKRPLLEPWPEFSEFSGYRPGDTLHKDVEEYNPAKQTNGNEYDDTGKNPFIELNDGRELSQKRILNQEPPLVQEQKQSFDDRDDDSQYRRDHMIEDKSLSEFSAEMMNSGQRQKIDDDQSARDKFREKTVGVLNEYEKAQDKCLYDEFSNRILGKFINLLTKYDDEDIDTNYYVLKNTMHLAKAIEKFKDSNFKRKELEIKGNSKSIIIVTKCKDKVKLTIKRQTLLDVHKKLKDELNVENDPMNPLSLKDILKRSNGTSLSEILQQHNLSLADLLHGKENAVSLFKSQTLVDTQTDRNQEKAANNVPETTDLKPDEIHKENEDKELLNSETKYTPELITSTIKEYPTTTEEMSINNKDEYTTTTAKSVEDNVSKILTKRRYPSGLRKKLRLRPMLNNTYKAQLSRDLITLNSRKYSHHRRNVTKFRQWKDVVPAMGNFNTSTENTLILEVETTTSANVPDETTINNELETNTNTQLDLQAKQENKIDDINMDIITTTELATKIIETPKHTSNRPSVVSMPRPTAISSGLRRQAFNNRLKRKRMKFKNSTNEPPQDDIIKHLLGMGTLVSSSEFIARTQEPKNTDEDNEDHTTIENFISTQSTSKPQNDVRHIKDSTYKISTSPMPTIRYTTTEESAKIEIEEILNDTQTSANLSRILKERNMTLSELVEHRERGSSHVHLADIFHNASREPNPPEPFLSKSLIEPISKETYPLRALLDANSHDPTAKATTIDPSMIQMSNVNIPVVMDFRNNVNENAENMGIMSLFNNFTKTKTPINKDSEGRAYETSIIAMNTTHEPPSNIARESRILTESIDDVVSWNEIFSLMRKNQKNETGSNHHTEVTAQIPYKKISLDEDADGDGLIALEDLQHLKVFENNIGTGSDEKLEARTIERTELPPAESGILERIPSQTKSVTVATASIAGLAMILFLLTYALFKWREQRLNIRKKNSFCDERIQTPVFENRKGHKNNSSMRSISPMLQTSNIYTLNTLDSKAGKESPDYMWDSLRKPFQ